MKEQDKAMARDLNRTDASNMPYNKFEVMIIRIFTGLEIRVKDISVTLNTEMRNNKAEIKGFKK